MKTGICKNLDQQNVDTIRTNKGCERAVHECALHGRVVTAPIRGMKRCFHGCRDYEVAEDRPEEKHPTTPVKWQG